MILKNIAFFSAGQQKNKNIFGFIFSRQVIFLDLGSFRIVNEAEVKMCAPGCHTPPSSLKKAIALARRVWDLPFPREYCPRVLKYCLLGICLPGVPKCLGIFTNPGSRVTCNRTQVSRRRRPAFACNRLRSYNAFISRECQGIHSQLGGQYLRPHDAGRQVPNPRGGCSTSLHRSAVSSPT